MRRISWSRGAQSLQSRRCHSTWLPEPCWGCWALHTTPPSSASGSLPMGAALAGRCTGGNGWSGCRAACLVRTLPAVIRAGHAGWPLCALAACRSGCKRATGRGRQCDFAGSDAKNGFRRRRNGGLFTAVVRTPLTGILLVAAMTERLDLALPLLVASLGAIVTSTALGTEPIYDTLRTRMPANDSLK